jgi:hypothetical protein
MATGGGGPERYSGHAVSNRRSPGGRGGRVRSFGARVLGRYG